MIIYTLTYRTVYRLVDSNTLHYEFQNFIKTTNKRLIQKTIKKYIIKLLDEQDRTRNGFILLTESIEEYNKEETLKAKLKELAKQSELVDELHEELGLKR